MSGGELENEGTATQAQTHTENSSWSTVSRDLRVHGLTVIFHPDPDRIGERTVIDGLGAGRDVVLSRREPEFAAPGAHRGRPLEDRRLSRTPIVLRPRGGGVEIDRSQSQTRIAVDGQQVESCLAVTAEDLAEGVLLLLGSHVLLLLHLLDPVADTVTPRFGLIGESPPMAQLRRDIVRTSDLRVPVLLRGESGSGKELVARAIHDAGPRRHGPYVTVNMAALPPSLAAAELFGAERGAYTGADRRRPGLFERAAGGTLFLDEVGETPPEVQALLLRTLETGEIQPVGGGRTLTPDVRILSATDADLEAAIHVERFRGPLFHRLGGYVMRLPPLRQRREDFGRLLVHFLRRELAEVDRADLLLPRPRPWLPAMLIARLAAWHWPGNVRQLGNAVRQMVIANRDADPATRFEEVENLLAGPGPGPGPAPRPAAPTIAPPRRKAAEITESEVVAALRAHRFRPAAAADALSIPRSSIYDLMDKISSLRKASELTREEIEEARARVGPSLEATAADLEVSLRALRRRLGQLEP